MQINSKELVTFSLHMMQQEFWILKLTNRLYAELNFLN